MLDKTAAKNRRKRRHRGGDPARALPQPGQHPGGRAARLRPVPAEPGEGHEPSVARPGGGGGGLRRRHEEGRPVSFCTYRGHAHTLARGVPVEKVLGELMQRDNGLMRGKGGSMHLMSDGARRDGLLRHHRRASADRLRRGLARAIQEAGRRVGLLLRRRHHQHRRVPRGAELRRGLEAAGDLRLREQSLHGIHADRRRHGGAEPGRRPRLGLRAGEDRDRRQRRRRGLSRGA